MTRLDRRLTVASNYEPTDEELEEFLGETTLYINVDEVQAKLSRYEKPETIAELGKTEGVYTDIEQLRKEVNRATTDWCKLNGLTTKEDLVDE